MTQKLVKTKDPIDFFEIDNHAQRNKKVLTTSGSLRGNEMWKKS